MNEDDVRHALPIAEIVAIVERTLRAAATGTAFGPLRSVLATGAGWFATMPAYVEDGKARALGAKLVTAFPSNAARGLPTHQARIVLLEPSTGAYLATIAGEYITEMRTAAMSVLATRALAAKPAGAHAILGAGVQGRAHLHAFVACGHMESLRVWSRSPERVRSLVNEACALGVTAQAAASAREAVENADVVTTVTAAADPLFDADALGVVAHVNAVGACVPDRRELPGALVGRSRVYADSLTALFAESGDVLLAFAEGSADREVVVGELGAVLEGTLPIPSGAPKTTIFKSLGLGILDVAVAAAAYQRR